MTNKKEPLAWHKSVQPGVLIISHGSPDPEWAELVDGMASELMGLLPEGISVEAVFLDNQEGRLIQDGIDRLEAQGITEIIVIPLFVSSGSTHIDEITYALGIKSTPEKETDMERLRISARVSLGVPIHDDPLIAELVWDKVKGLSKQPEREALVLVGHGSRHDGFRQRWEEGIAALSARIGELSGLAAADYALLNPGSLRSQVSRYNQEMGDGVIVAPLFLSAGYFTKRVIPDRLNGLQYRYSGEPLLPHPLVARWMYGQILNIMRSVNN